ncbi:hypothetical protein CYMTET_18248 [Cymbomonas tetramitiformis]|uniref:Integrase catalytic domain-containing protein n=1 Tax=Cymbomonas tetramitiformis TaxID=36881 RepID=A0AAE0G9T9_9CHLO|nr:hypothetical protein CYMTET_18248 [Cymbomonas tetramitiformis]
MVKGKSYSQATTPSPPGGAPASEEKPGESSLRDIALSGQQEQISALTDMMKGIHAQLYELRSLSQTGPRATVPVDQHLNSSPAGGQRPLPSLSDMTKGLSADSHFSGKETDQEGIWDEWLAKIQPSLRHPSLALLLSESTPLHMVRGDDSYLEEANQLFYDFLCRVTTSTANAVVHSYEQHSDGHGAWLELSKLRRNTSVVYFINQVDKLLLLPNQLSRLAPPLPTFLESKETLRRLREYSVNARVTPSGKPLCMETVETIYSAIAIVRLHPDCMLLKAKFMLEYCERKQEEVKRQRLVVKLKSDYLKAFKLYLEEVKRLRSTMDLSSEYHMVLHTDGDSTMIAGQTAAFCEEHGIEQRHGSPYLHENHARVERSHRDVQAMARALLLTSGFGVDMWPLATRHAVYILNRVFRKSLGWTSAYYLIQKKYANLSQLRVFGCMAYPFIDPTVREHKLSNRARELRYVGHSEVSSAYLLYDHESGKVVNSGMVTFSERLDKLGKVVTTWDPSAVTPLKTNFMVTTLDAPYKDPPPTLLETAVLEQGVYLPEGSDEIVAVVKVETSDDVCWVSLSSYLKPGSDRLSLLRDCPTYGSINAHYPLFTEVRVVTGKGDSEEAMLCGRAIAPHAQPYCVVLLTNFTIMDLPAGDVRFPPAHTCLGVKAAETPTVQSSLLPEGVTEPKSHSQVLTSPDCIEWLNSIQDELEALVQIKKALLMMNEEDVPAGVKLLDMSLVLKVKLDKNRQLLKRKSRICVRGNKQECGVDYYDTFAPCTQLSSVRLVITLALNLGLVVYHMDVDTAFLNSVLEEDLYVCLPRGLVYGGHRCAKLLKAVYGLRQAGREWFDTSDAFIMGYDSRMQRSDVEPCLYFIRDAALQVIILAYVDDYLVATNDKSWYDTFVTTFHAQYACKDLGVLDLVMGIGVRWGSDTAYLSQSGYISQMISTYGVDEAKPASLPMSPGTALTPADGKGSMPYRALLGQLQWVARCSRPDIMAAVSVLSRFCATYGPQHFVALKPLPLSIYTDADYAGCKVTRRSTSGIAVFLCGSLIIFSSMIQKCVSLSTTEAEIIAMSEGAREVKYVLNVLDSLVDICRPVPMYCDNQGAIHLATDYVNNSRSKHIEVRNMYIRELVKAKDTEALYTGTDDNTSDIMTKPLALPVFRVHRERLGVMNLPRGDQ